eukprot:CAMPEP_0194273108 /NCGR_PEP_ID=MMETSP0169-20130528/6516_1 /TAXON_ID=218684 /ORGANISM="Corethron pennatum, Strain L29A3" /LENGTH=772 /DNA_ID=CAMNT_0039015959 /DNA_START=106 /DNA_END=2424 /DNA_ORIENTATION=-
MVVEILNVATKKRKLNDREMALGFMNDDSLRAILLPTLASDHPNLRLSCRRICQILDSSIYRKERSEQGYAEVKVELLSPFEQYKRYRESMNMPLMNPSNERWLKDTDDESEEDEEEKEASKAPCSTDEEFVRDYDHLGNTTNYYGDRAFYSNTFRVFVDGWPLNDQKKIPRREFKLKVQLLRLRAPFYQKCDADSQCLMNLASSLFTKRGTPKAACIKDAVDGDRRPLLYIAEFETPVEYRSTSSTVGPLIIQEILKIFRDEYSVAVYIPWGDTQYAEEEMYPDRHAERILGRDLTDKEVRAKAKRDERFRALTDQDIRQFFRAGFRQVDEASIVDTAANSYVYATPGLEIRSVLTERQALDRTIASKPPPPPEKTGLARELLYLIRNKCDEHRQTVERIKCWQQPLEKVPIVAQSLRMLEQMIDDQTHKIHEMRNAAEESIEKMRSQRRLLLDQKTFVEELPEGSDLSSFLEKIHSMLETLDLLDGLDTSCEGVSDVTYCFDMMSDKIIQNEKELSKYINTGKQMIEELKAKLNEQRCIVYKNSHPVIKENLAKEEASLESLMKDVREAAEAILDRADTDEARHQVLLNADAIHACATHKNLVFVGMVLGLLPPPQRTGALNRLDSHGLSALMLAGQASQLGGLESGEYRQFIEALVALGADVNVVDAKTGFSALGHFRNCRHSSLASLYGGQHSASELRQLEMLEIAKIEILLTPDGGATDADKSLLFDEEDDDEEEMESEESSEDDGSSDDDGDHDSDDEDDHDSNGD